MAKVQYKGLLVLAFIVLCSFSTASSSKELNPVPLPSYQSVVRVLEIVFERFCFFPAARSLLREMKVDRQVLAGDGLITPNGDGVTTAEADELSTMDYTPARKKPPIHN